MGRGRGPGAEGAPEAVLEEAGFLLDHFSSSLLSSILLAHLLEELKRGGEGGRAARRGRGRAKKKKAKAGRWRKGAQGLAEEPLRMRRLRKVSLAASVPGHFSKISARLPHSMLR